jgi:uncharacterized membrane protein YbhN (UPF0104 family)
VARVRTWRRWLSGALFATFAGALLVRRRDVATVLVEIGELSAEWMVVLGVLTAAAVGANGWLASSITAGLSPARGVMVQQAATAANNTAVGSGPVSLGVRIAMLRSWRVDDVAIGVTVVALNVVAAYRLWTATLFTAVIGAGGAADGVVGRRLFHFGIALSAAVLVGSTVIWWALLHHPRPLHWLAGRAEALLGRARRRVRRLPEVDLAVLVERGRVEGRRLVGERGRRIALAAVVEQAVVLALPVAVVRAFGIGPDVVSTAEVLVAFGLVRLVAALSPIPGGIGITEVGISALLVRFGGAEPTVVAAVLTYRTLTFLLPIVVGGVCFGLWRRDQERRRRAEPASACSACGLPAGT